MAEKLYLKTKSKLYSILDFLSLVGTAGGIVAGVAGIISEDNAMTNYGLLLFSTSLAYHCGTEISEKRFIEAGLEKKLKKK